MHAGVNYVQIQPGKMNEAIAIHRDSVVPAASQRQGNRGGLLLTDPNTGKAIVIGLWETEADIPTGEAGGWYQEQVSKSAQLRAGPVVRELYEVSAGESTLGTSGATHARVNYRQIQPDRMEEAISMYRDVVAPAANARTGCLGGFVLTNRSTGKTIAISLWETEAAMRAGQPIGDVDAISGGPPLREHYEVSVQV